jgi:hypothetical protein
LRPPAVVAPQGLRPPAVVAPKARRRRGRPIVSVLLLIAVVWLAVGAASADGAMPAGPPPPAGGYLHLRPVGSYPSLPGDAEAAALVHRSGWEIRPGNVRYNHTTPKGLRLVPRDPAARAYDPKWNTYVLNRITGHFTGTTDEILQWVAAKWGVPDDLIRTIAFLESHWNQSNYGDFVHDRAQCPVGISAHPCPVSFGIVGTKSTSWAGLFPWNRYSTAAAADALGGWLRGCYEGWVWWLRDHGETSHGRYAAGDLWGCVGAWYSGDWHDGVVGIPSAENYINRARKVYRSAPWRTPGF